MPGEALRVSERLREALRASARLSRGGPCGMECRGSSSRVGWNLERSPHGTPPHMGWKLSGFHPTSDRIPRGRESPFHSHTLSDLKHSIPHGMESLGILSCVRWNPSGFHPIWDGTPKDSIPCWERGHRAFSPHGWNASGMPRDSMLCGMESLRIPLWERIPRDSISHRMESSGVRSLTGSTSDPMWH